MTDFLKTLNQNQKQNPNQPFYFPSQQPQAQFQPQSQQNPFNFNNTNLPQSNNQTFFNPNSPNQYTSQPLLILPNLTSTIINNPYPTSNAMITGQSHDAAYDHSMLYLHNKEVFNILQSFLNSLDLKNPANVYKYMMYNSIPQNIKNTIHALVYKRYYPYQKTINNTFNCIDYQLWQQALKFNPNPESLYPLQLSSPDQLKQRAEQNEKMQMGLLKTLQMSKAIVEKSKVMIDNTVNNELSLIKQKRNVIKIKMCSICKQISSLAVLKCKAKKDVDLENSINSKVTELKKSLDEKGDLMVKLNRIAACPVDVFHPLELVSSNEQTRMTDERVLKATQALKDMRSLVNFASANIQNNILIAQGIQNDLEYYKSNGCFRDR